MFFFSILVESHHHGAEGVKGCRFPKWLTEHHQWHTLDHQKTFHFATRNATLRESVSPAGAGGVTRVQMRAVCHNYESESDTQARIVTHVTTGW